MKRAKVFITCVATIVLFMSCKSGLIHNTVYSNDSHPFGDAFGLVNPSAPGYRRLVTPSGIEYRKTFSWYSDETIASEQNAIDYLEMKLNKYPKKTKYSDALEKFNNKLYDKYKKRVQDRMIFLREFYTDMYKLSNKDFSKKYKRHCDKELLKGINNIKPKKLHVEGDHWYVFTDLRSHRSDDYKFSYMNGDPQKVNNSKVALYIYEDSVKTAPIYQYKQKYRLTDIEDKWYKVSMGNKFVMVKVEEKRRNIKITGLVNLAIPFAYMNVPQIPERSWDSVTLKIGEGIVIKHNDKSN